MKIKMVDQFNKLKESRKKPKDTRGTGQLNMKEARNQLQIWKNKKKESK